MAEAYTQVAEQFDLTLLGTDFRISTEHYNEVAFQLDYNGPTALTGVVTIQRSINGLAWYALGTPITIAVASITDPIDCSGFTWIRAVVTTAQALQVRLTAYVHDARK